ncbi:glycoside hydrolase family 3 protein [Mucilaginibacter sp. SP1R1]|uniref:glycoside hydrolase family 3 protein n=1 Tax=Mucilaginibacter sp. SP1R1 TaxID=2723091 RepID=UPI001616B03E|nr:glycoside hydrolase family 3 protein [Mucilaginibacter sp. SP1R1]MBB6149986.1 beta-glucosidase-like glycosyl hydrolase [Mucilaginibacter sp. SP1R1]
MKKTFIYLLITICLGSTSLAQNLPYKNKKLSPEVRARDLISRMTLDEKLMQMQCIWNKKSTIFTNGEFDEAKAQKEFQYGLGEIARINESGAPSSSGLHPKQAAILYNKVQHFFVEKTRLGIPVMVHEEGLHGQQTQDATNYPVPIGLASSWNENLVTEIYTNVAQEIKARGGQQVLAPVVDIVRDPRWGRTEETMGEDPFLISRLAVAQVKAYQGNSVYLDKDHVAATLKHFGVHGQSEGGNNTGPSNINERLAKEIFFKSFKAAIEQAAPMNVMSSYNDLWGKPAHANKKLLTDILRNEYGFKGVIVSDYGGVSNLKNENNITPSLEEAGYMAFKAGIDIELPDPESFTGLKEYVKAGKISIAEINNTVTRILINKFRTGLFDDPYVDPERASTSISK